MTPEYPSPYEVAESQNAEAQKQEEAEVKTGNACLKWFIFLLILLIAGVSLWWFYFREQAKKTPVKEPASKEEKDKNVIGSDGGVITEAGVKITIPKGALERKVKISIEKVREGRVTALYHLKPDDLVFLKPVTVMIPYNDEKLYTWETPYMISLYTGRDEDNVSQKKLTSVNTIKETVAAEMSKF